MKIAVTGSSGFLGTQLVSRLREQGHQVLRLVRRVPRGGDEVFWDPAPRETGGRTGTAVDLSSLEGTDAVVHLAGAPVGGRRWSEAYKRELRESRVGPTALLAAALARLRQPPAVLLCASAVGWYGTPGERAVDESEPAGTGFLSELCVEWEAAADAARAAGIRTVHLRTGLVLDRSGGMLGRILPLFRLGLGGRLGDGRQYLSFVSLRDYLRAVDFLLTDGKLSGPVNVVAPAPARNSEFTRALGQQLRRPTVLAVPEWALRLALGEFSVEVLGSQRVLPRTLLETGFVFDDPTVFQAVRSALDGRLPPAGPGAASR